MSDFWQGFGAGIIAWFVFDWAIIGGLQWFFEWLDKRDH